MWTDVPGADLVYVVGRTVEKGGVGEFQVCNVIVFEAVVVDGMAVLNIARRMLEGRKVSNDHYTTS